jgi:hypothetical protein
MPAKKVSKTKKPAAKKKAPAKKKSVAKKKPTVKKKAPVKKMAPAKKKASLKKKPSLMHKVEEEVKQVSHVCRSCHALPVGATELMSILLVVSFAVSAVLLTSVYANRQMSQQVQLLEAQIQK